MEGGGFPAGGPTNGKRKVSSAPGGPGGLWAQVTATQLANAPRRKPALIARRQTKEARIRSIPFRIVTKSCAAGMLRIYARDGNQKIGFQPAITPLRPAVNLVTASESL